MIHAVALLLVASPAAAGHSQTVARQIGARHDYAQAIHCAAGEAVLAELVGADPADSDTVVQINTLARHWLRVAMARAVAPAAVRPDLARSMAQLRGDLAGANTPADLANLLDRRLDACAVEPGVPGPGVGTPG